MQGKKWKPLMAVGALTAMLGVTVLAGGSATAETVRAGNMIMKADGFLKPNKLPKKGMAPTALTVKGSIKTVDGSHPDPIKTIVIDFDKAGRVFNKGLPTCRPAQIANTRTRDAIKNCKKAIVGRGKAMAEVAFPDQAPFDAPAPLVIFNAKGKGGQPGLLIHAFAFVPTPTTFIVPVKFSKSPNKRLYHHRVTVRVPTIAGGSGSLLSFETRIKKTYRYKGKKVSYIMAGCPKGVHRAVADMSFRDGTRLKASVARPCKSTR